MNFVLATLSTLASLSIATLEAKLPATDAPPSVAPVELAVNPAAPKPGNARPGTADAPVAAGGGYRPKPAGKPTLLPEAKPEAQL